MFSSLAEIANEASTSIFFEDAPLSREHFLRNAAEDGHAPAMHLLGLESTDPDEKRQCLFAAARKGYVPAIYAYGLLCENLHVRKSWFRKAAFEGHRGAIRMLVNESRDPADKVRWLRLTDATEHLPEMEEFLTVCEILDDKERLLAEADRNGWRLETAAISSMPVSRFRLAEPS
jgi:hypothetical protein